FADTARSFGAETEGSARRQLDALAVDMPARPGRTGDEEWATAARTAFVRLYERGLLRLVESVASECPGCRTVLDGLDCEPVELDDPHLRVRLPYDDGSGELEVDVSGPELLPGVVGVVVPVGHDGAGRRVDVPL